MTTRLDKTLKRELALAGRTFILTVSPEGLKLTLKGKRNGQELRWSDLISGDAALAAALNASVGTFETGARAPVRKEPPPREPAPAKSKRPSRARKG
jgi:hypothetical protein